MKRSLFWGSIVVIVYTYIGFPLLILIRGLLRPRPVKKAAITPRVSVVIIAYNEAATIGAKLDSTLALDYPSEQLEIIVASDGSNDGTNAIVERYGDPRVQFYPFPRQGKIPVLNAVVERARGEILVFSDANTIFAPDALRALVSPFADPAVGAVGGNQCYVPNGASNAAGFGERLYWSFDRMLKTMQSRAGNAISATGAIYAIRREVFRPVPLGVGDDFVISTRAISQGYRLVFEPTAIAYETPAPTDREEFRRKERVIVQGLRGLWAVKELFNPLRYGFYSVQIFSHKLLRWSVTWPLVVLLAVSSGMARAGGLYRLITLGQAGFYACALGALALRRTPLAQQKLFKLLMIPFFFCLANIAALRAWLQLLAGKNIVVWDSTERGVERAQRRS